jgi:hypothetical protein
MSELVPIVGVDVSPSPVVEDSSSLMDERVLCTDSKTSRGVAVEVSKPVLIGKLLLIEEIVVSIGSGSEVAKKLDTEESVVSIEPIMSIEELVAVVSKLGVVGRTSAIDENVA